jgi:hypothetical protein
LLYPADGLPGYSRKEFLDDLADAAEADIRGCLEQVRDRVLAAAGVVSPERLGTCDDCGFSPFADDTSTSRDTAFAKIRARVEGTALASEALGT